MILRRRGFLGGLLALPAVVSAGSLMRVKMPASGLSAITLPDGPYVPELVDFGGTVWAGGPCAVINYRVTPANYRVTAVNWWECGFDELQDIIRRGVMSDAEIQRFCDEALFA